MAIIGILPILDAATEVTDLAKDLVQQKAIPEKAAPDALHVAFATFHGINYLLTWNFKHIANAQMRSKIARVCRAAGYEPAEICTPEELIGD